MENTPLPFSFVQIDSDALLVKTTLPKIIKARKMLNTLPNKPLLEVDGGVNLQNIAGIAGGG